MQVLEVALECMFLRVKMLKVYGVALKCGYLVSKTIESPWSGIGVYAWTETKF